MSIRLPNVAARLFDVPLMIDARKAVTILAALGDRLFDGGVTLDTPSAAVDHVAFANGRPSGDRAGRLGDPLGRRLDEAGVGDKMLDIVDGVAIIPIEGTLVHKGKWLGSYSGDTSYEGLQTRVARAMDLRKVKGVVFEVDSFGGEVAGAFETADMIARLSAIKPTIAILTDFALSAGYLLASAARQVVMPATGSAGSIGVITLHADFSKQLAEEGIKVTVLASGKHKADGSPFEPLPPEVATRIRASLDQGRDLFAAAVARNRGTRLSKEAALATEALDFRGGDAVEAGLVDGIVRPNEAFEQFVLEVNRSAGRSISRSGSNMSKDQGLNAVHAAVAASAADNAANSASVEAEATAVLAQAKADGIAEGVKSGANAALARAQMIINAPEAKGREALAQKLAFETELSPAQAVEMLKVAPAAEKTSMLAGRVPAPQVDAGAGEKGNTAQSAAAGLHAAVTRNLAKMGKQPKGLPASLQSH